MISVLRDKRLPHLVEPYLTMSDYLKRQEYAYIKKKIKTYKSMDFEKLIIKYLDKYEIDYEGKKKIQRSPEKKENISNRQKKYIEKQRLEDKKKIQVYVDESVHELLVRMARYKGVTQAELITMALKGRAMYWDK